MTFIRSVLPQDPTRKSFSPGLYTYAPPESLIQFLCDFIHEIKDPIERSKIQILLPTARAARNLKLSLARSRDTASGMILPTIQSLIDLSSQLPHFKSQTLSTQHRRLILMMLYAKAKKQSIDTVSVHQVDELCRLFEELCYFEIPEINLLQTSDYQFSEQTQQALSFAAKIYKDYLSWLSDHKRLDPGHLLVRAINHKKDNITANIPLIIAGIDGYIPAAHELIKTACRTPSCWVLMQRVCRDNVCASTHPDGLLHKNHQLQSIPHIIDKDPSHRNFFTTLFSNRVIKEHEQRPEAPDYVQPIDLENSSDEAMCASLIAINHLRTQDCRVAIVCPDPMLAERIQCHLKKWSVDVDTGIGTPLINSAIGRIFLSIKALVMDPNALEILFQLFKSDGIQDTSLKHHVLAAEKKFRHAGTLDEVTRQHLMPLQDRFNRISSLLGKNVFDALDDLINSLLNPKIIEALSSHLNRITAYNPEIINSLTSEQCLELLEQSLREDRLHLPKSHARLNLVEPLQAPYLDSEIKILCGLEEGQWPATPTSSPYMNRPIRCLLGLPDTQILVGRAASLFCASFGRKKTYLLSSKSARDGPKKTSRWIKRFNAHFRLSWEIIEQNKKIHEHLRYLKRSTKVPDPTLGRFTRKNQAAAQVEQLMQSAYPKRLSIKDLVTYEQNPYAFFARCILRLYQTVPPYEDTFSQSYGSWVHRVIEQASQLKNPNSETLEKIALSNFDPLLKPQIKISYLSALRIKLPFLCQHLAHLNLKRTTTECEKKLSTVIKPKVLKGIPIEIYGYADRVDQLKSGTLRLIEYKTGKAPSQKAINTLESPQVAYLTWLLGCNTSRSKVTDCHLVDVKREQVIDLDPTELAARAQEKILKLCEEIFDPDCSFSLLPGKMISTNNDLYSLLGRLDACRLRTNVS